MAKAQGPGFVDKHIEKIILGACLLGLIYAVMQFGVSTPIVPFPGEAGVAPQEVDDVIFEKAEDLLDKTKDAKPKPVPIRDDLEKLKKLQDNPVTGQGFIVAFGVPVSSGIRKQTGIRAGNAPPLDELVKVMPLPKQPVSWAGKELIFIEQMVDGEEEEILNEVPVWRAVVWYPWKELAEVWKKKLENTVVIPDVTALGCEIEIQERVLGGVWKTTDAVKPVLLPIRDDRGETIEPELIPSYDGTNGVEVRQALSDFYEGWMSYQLQPDFYEIWTKEENQTWMSHFPFEILEIYPPEQEDSEKTDARQSRNLKRTPTRRTVSLPRGRAATARGRARQRRPDMMMRPPDRGGGRNTRGRQMRPDMMMRPPDMMMRPPDRGSGRNARGRQMRPDMMMRPPDRGGARRPATPRQSRPKRRPNRRNIPKKAVAAQGEEKAPPPEIPDLQRQIEVGKTLAWFHTTGIQFGREYRCRFRFVFANPLLTYSGSVDPNRPQDSKTPRVKTEWSPWSKPISVNRDVEFFVTGSNPLRKQLAITIFTKYLDQRISHKIGIVVAGQNIRGKVRTKVMNPATGDLKKDKDGQDPIVDFDTGAIAVKFNFNKRITTSSGRPKNDAAEMIYLDRFGRLRSRIMYFDRNSDQYKKLQDEADEVRSMIEPEKPHRRSEERRARPLPLRRPPGDQRRPGLNEMMPPRGDRLGRQGRQGRQGRPRR